MTTARTFILLALHVLQPIEGFPQYTISKINTATWAAVTPNPLGLVCLDGPIQRGPEEEIGKKQAGWLAGWLGRVFVRLCRL
jgi:hypothetical protein